MSDDILHRLRGAIYHAEETGQVPTGLRLGRGAMKMMRSTFNEMSAVVLRQVHCGDIEIMGLLCDMWRTEYRGAK